MTHEDGNGHEHDQSPGGDRRAPLGYTTDKDFFLTVLRARTNTSRGAASPHFEVYGFVPDVLSSNPLLGLGLKEFVNYKLIDVVDIDAHF